MLYPSTDAVIHIHLVVSPTHTEPLLEAPPTLLVTIVDQTRGPGHPDPLVVHTVDVLDTVPVVLSLPTARVVPASMPHDFTSSSLILESV